MELAPDGEGAVLAAAGVPDGNDGVGLGMTGKGDGIAASACCRSWSTAGDVARAGVSRTATPTTTKASASRRGRLPRIDGRAPVV